MKWRKLVKPFTKNFWKRWWDRRTLGFDDSELWSLDYTIAKFIAPRLKKYMEVCKGKVPYQVLNDVQKKYIKDGYKFDYVAHRFSDKKIEDKVWDEAEFLWHKILQDMLFAFQDYLEEENNWEVWKDQFNNEAEKFNKKMNRLKSEKDKAKFWYEQGFGTIYSKGAQATSEEFARKYRQEGLRLFTIWYQNLWL